MGGLTRLAIHRPVTMLMIILAMLLMGAISFTRLPVQNLPTFTFPFVTVVVRFPGASPNDIFQTVTRPIENAVSTVGGISQITGTSSDGVSRVSIQFTVGSDVNIAANDVAQVINRIQAQLPTGTQPPSIIKANPNSMPIMNLALSGGLPKDQLYDLATNLVQPALEQVEGVAAVDVQGGLVRQVNVTVKPGALVAHGIALEQVVQAIRTQNLTVPGGTTTLNERTLSVRTEAYYQNADQLQDLVLIGSQQAPVLLKQVADVQVGTAPVTRYARINGEDAVGLSVTAQDGANIVQVAHNLRERMQRLVPALPPNTTTTVINDQSASTEKSMDAIKVDLILVVLLAGLVLLLFLHRFRNTFIVMCAIPTSMIPAFTAMYFLGLSLDTISLLALALCTGILVDDSIVVLENINRHLGLGKNPQQAALEGRLEIGLAALAITLTDIVVYVPIAFTSGLVGRLFREFGLVIAAATLLSLFVSFTLTPLLAARWLRKGDEEAHIGGGRAGSPWERFIALWEGGYGRLQGAYGRSIGVALRHRPLVLLVGVASLALSLAFLPLGWLTTEFTPQTDDSQFSVSVQFPTGTALSRTDEAVRRLEEQIRALPGIEHTYATAGGGGGGFGGGGGANGNIAVDLLPLSQRAPMESYLAEVRTMARQFPGASIITQVRNPLRIGGGGRNVGVILQGPDNSVLADLANDTAELLRGVPGVTEVRNEAAQAVPGLSVQIDRRRAADLGIQAQAIGNTVQTAMSGVTAGYLRPGSSTLQTPIVVRVEGADRLTPQQIGALPLSGRAGLMALSDVASVLPTSSPAQITDQNRQLQISVSAATSGVPLSVAVASVQKAMATQQLPPGYSYRLGGAAQQQQDVFGPMFGAFILATILVYMLTAALYESLLEPLAVLLSLPLATVGALGALTLTGNTLNLFSFMGLIMLVGIVAKNAILLLDYTKTLQSQGMERTAALVEAGRTRLRPIVMTTLTMVFAMLPLAFKFEAGSEQRAPMAIVIIGGLLTSTLLTLFFVPVTYTYLNSFGAWLARRGLAGPQALRSVAAPASAAPLPPDGAAARPAPAFGRAPSPGSLFGRMLRRRPSSLDS